MAPTYSLIASNTLTTTAASVTFSSIPASYTDLVLRYTFRTGLAGSNQAQARLVFNGNTATNYSRTTLGGDGSTPNSNRATSQANFEAEEGSPSAGNTANTFGTTEIYIPNYLVSANKAFGSFAVGENNSTTALMGVRAGLWRVTDAITSITLTANANSFVSGSSFFLYGIKNS